MPPALGKILQFNLEKAAFAGYTHIMQVLHSDERRRVTLPVPAKPLDSWVPEVLRPDQILLTRVKKPATQAARARIVKRGGYSVGILRRRIDPKAIGRALAEFP